MCLAKTTTTTTTKQNAEAETDAWPEKGEKMANLAEPLQTGHSRPATGHKARRLPPCILGVSPPA